MRPGLVGYFDIGESYGLGDDVFPEEERAPMPDIGMVGIHFPFGSGLRVDLLEEGGLHIPALWREAAVKQLARPEMETGWSDQLGVSRTEFLRELAELIAHHPVTRCEMHVHAVGTVYAELQLGAGIPVPYMHGVLACFEFAGYTPPLADAFLEAAHRRVESALGPSLTGLVALSRRDPPEVKTDSKGYTEKWLFSTFTRVVACVDEGDEQEVAALTTAMQAEPDDSIRYEYHGILHYGWGYVLEPNQVSGWQEETGEGESPEQQIMRIEADIRAAQVCLGTLEAFTRLFVSEIQQQVGGYISNDPGGRSPQELNRLRALALAVVSLTDFDQVTATEEDHVYFRKFSEVNRLERKQHAIQDATSVLYQVQAAEMQSEEAKRQTVLNWIALLLASLSLISVGAVGYDFIRDDESLIAAQGERAWLFVVVTVIVALLVVAVMFATRSRTRR